MKSKPCPCTNCVSNCNNKDKCDEYYEWLDIHDLEGKPCKLNLKEG